MSDEQTDFSWTPLGEKFWRDAAASCTHKPSEQQLRFAVCKHDDLTASDAAKRAGYVGDAERIRQAGSRANKTTAVQELLSYAFAETGTGDDGVVKNGEAKRILSRIARAGDNNAKIKSLESLAKIERDEAAANRRSADDAGDPVATAAQIICALPCGTGATLAAGLWVALCGQIETFPFLRLVGPFLARTEPDEWRRWRGTKSNPYMDEIAAGPVLGPDEIIAALKNKTSPQRARVDDTVQEGVGDAAGGIVGH
jgi:hypothetical protein